MFLAKPMQLQSKLRFSVWQGEPFPMFLLLAPWVSDRNHIAQVPRNTLTTARNVASSANFAHFSCAGAFAGGALCVRPYTPGSVFGARLRDPFDHAGHS
jgi:hypothetical protein